MNRNQPALFDSPTPNLHIKPPAHWCISFVALVRIWVWIPEHMEKLRGSRVGQLESILALKHKGVAIRGRKKVSVLICQVTMR